MKALKEEKFRQKVVAEAEAAKAAGQRGQAQVAKPKDPPGKRSSGAAAG